MSPVWQRVHSLWQPLACRLPLTCRLCRLRDLRPRAAVQVPECEEDLIDMEKDNFYRRCTWEGARRARRRTLLPPRPTDTRPFLCLHHSGATLALGGAPLLAPLLSIPRRGAAPLPPHADRICPAHCKAAALLFGGIQQRFCQQVGGAQSNLRPHVLCSLWIVSSGRAVPLRRQLYLPSPAPPTNCHATVLSLPPCRRVRGQQAQLPQRACAAPQQAAQQRQPAQARDGGAF